MATRRASRSPAPLAALGFALVVPASIGAGSLAVGGIAPLALAAVIATAIGVPLAQVEWMASRTDPTPLDDAARSVSDVWSLLLVGALAAPWIHAPGPWGLPMAALVWLAAGLASAAGARAVPLVAATALLLGLAAAGAGVVQAPPWTLLEPGWAAWRAWVPSSVAAGFLLAGAGFGQWRALPEPVPGTRRQGWAVAGAALGLALLVAVRAGSWYETGATDPDPLGRAVAALALAAAGCAILDRDDARAHPFRYAAAGVLTTWWFAGPAAGALPLWWGTLVLVGPAVWSGLLALRLRGTERAVAATAATLFAAGAAVGWPGPPPSPAAAAAAAATVVVAVWVAGTRALVRRPA